MFQNVQCFILVFSFTKTDRSSISVQASIRSETIEGVSFPVTCFSFLTTYFK